MNVPVYIIQMYIAPIASVLLEVGANPLAKNTIEETPLAATYDLRVSVYSNKPYQSSASLFIL